jgi:signal transduction histidine kinase
MVHALYLLIYLATLLRLVLRPPDQGVIGAAAYALMACFLAVGVAQVPLSRRWRWWTHAHLAIQSAIVTALFLTEPTVDFYGLLIVQLSIVATRELDSPGDVVWLAVLCVVVSFGLVLAFGPIGDVLSYTPSYVAACLLLGLYGRTSKKAEAARARSEELRAELEEANRRLRAYADQAEEAAAAQERARLSRELHDAATQTVFSMNLTAEAARMALAADPERVPALLDRLQELARGALAELRTLVHELRAVDAAEDGLARSLSRHATARERRDGVAVRLSVEGEERGSPGAKRALYRAAVEALNNVGKHAGVREAGVELRFTETEAIVRVKDGGRGFDPARPRPSESFGLASLGEELAALGGALRVSSAPGAGTEVEARVPLRAGEVPHEEGR